MMDTYLVKLVRCVPYLTQPSESRVRSICWEGKSKPSTLEMNTSRQVSLFTWQPQSSRLQSAYSGERDGADGGYGKESGAACGSTDTDACAIPASSATNTSKTESFTVVFFMTILMNVGCGVCVCVCTSVVNVGT
jgi:hypothetical protein